MGSKFWGMDVHQLPKNEGIFVRLFSSGELAVFSVDNAIHEKYVAKFSIGEMRDNFPRKTSAEKMFKGYVRSLFVDRIRTVDICISPDVRKILARLT